MKEWKELIILSFLSLSLLAGQAQQNSRPRIGLTLSGGGAKGLAHIGILKAIDSAGLKIDYITGTSMGSIIGSLYAIGYTGKEIENIARHIDWNPLLSNQITLRSLSMEEKEEYGRYAVELPYVHGRYHLPSGALEAQELWLKLAELYYPVHHIKDFNQFSIPFRCIAADVETAEPVVQDRGEIVTALRASMAIPGVFTPIENYGRQLVDGGVVRNFPVSDAKAMGADVVIGSNVALGLQSREKLTNPVQLLMQIAFFKEAEDNKKQVALCDLYIDQPLTSYHAGSFERTHEIIDSGIAVGNRLYPRLKQMADSLKSVYGHTSPVRLSRADSVFISSYEVTGLNRIRVSSFLHSINFREKRYYTAAQLASMIRRGYGTRNYNFIRYTLHPLPDGTTKIFFHAGESTPTFSKLGLHYHTFTGIGLIYNLTTRNYFTPNSRTLVTVNLSENFRARAEHLQYLGRLKTIAIIPNLQFETFKINTYNHFKKDGEYRHHYFRGDVRLQWANRQTFNLGAGTRYEWMKYRPTIPSLFEFRGQNHFLTSYGYFGVNTLDKPLFPDKGVKINGEAGWIFHQHPDLAFSSGTGGTGENLDSLRVHSPNYRQALLTAEIYRPVSETMTLSALVQSGVNFISRKDVFNPFFIGGLNRLYRNQLVFAGLQDMSIYSSSAAAVQLGVRWKPLSSFYIIARSNALVNDFIDDHIQLQKPKWLTGHALTFAYNSLLGPVELSGMYSEQAKSFQAYVSLGLSF